MAMVKCNECGGNISSEAKTCPHCGFSYKIRKILPKNIITILSVGFATLLLIVVILSSGKAWKHTFDVKYIEYNLDPYFGGYVYEITNKSDTTVSNVYAIVEVDTFFDGKFMFKSYVGSSIKPGETEEYKLNNASISSAARDHNINTGSYWCENVDIVGFKWE